MNKIFSFFIIKMNKRTLKLNNIKLNKKEFHKSKEPIDLFSVDLDQIVASHRSKHNEALLRHYVLFCHK